MNLRTLPLAARPQSVKPLSTRQASLRTRFDRLAREYEHWFRKHRYYHEADHDYLRFLIPPGASILDVGCGIGVTLAALRPSRGVGIDLSPEMVREARERFPQFSFHVGNVEDAASLADIDGTFDFVLLGDTIGYLEDIETTLAAIQRFCSPETRLIVTYGSRLWRPLLHAAERLGLKMRVGRENWLSTADITGLLQLADYEPIRREWRLLLPERLFGLGPFINRLIAPLPGIRRLCLRNYIVARSVAATRGRPAPSATVVIPCRNERGNIENAVKRLPVFAPQQEILFVEGHSSDSTYDECLRVRDAYPDRRIRVLKQPGKGKADAVRAAFAAAEGDILMILDADLTVPPELMPKFYQVLASGRGEFVNGTRLVYPVAPGAMRLLNFLANRAFAAIFSFLLNTRFTDTLCGTKVLWRSGYEKIKANRAYFGDFDPFGDFDLIFGASKLNLKIVELPVRYAAREYGETQISRFADGWLLARMVLHAWRKLKAV